VDPNMAHAAAQMYGMNGHGYWPGFDYATAMNYMAAPGGMDMLRNLMSGQFYDPSVYPTGQKEAAGQQATTTAQNQFPQNPVGMPAPYGYYPYPYMPQQYGFPQANPAAQPAGYQSNRGYYGQATQPAQAGKPATTTPQPAYQYGGLNYGYEGFSNTQPTEGYKQSTGFQGFQQEKPTTTGQASYQAGQTQQAQPTQQNLYQQGYYGQQARGGFGWGQQS
jgi:hypothetical protein